MSNCIYCGQSSQAGGNCFKSPSKRTGRLS